MTKAITIYGIKNCDTMKKARAWLEAKLPDADKEGLDARKAIALMLAQPSMIKRPVLDIGGKLLVGFKPDAYAAALR